EAGPVMIKVQNAALFQVEINPLLLGHSKQMLTGFDGKLRCGDRVFSIFSNGPEKFRQPPILVQGRTRVQEQRRVFLHHPAQALCQGRGLIPDFRVGGRELAAVRKRGLHGCVELALQNGNLVAGTAEQIGGRDAGDTGAEYGDTGHDVPQQEQGRQPYDCRTPSVSVPESFAATCTRPAVSPSVGGVSASLQIVWPMQSCCLRVSGAVAPSALALSQTLLHG